MVKHYFITAPGKELTCDWPVRWNSLRHTDNWHWIELGQPLGGWKAYGWANPPRKATSIPVNPGCLERNGHTMFITADSPGYCLASFGRRSKNCCGGDATS
jgi:hypothetical protein